MARAAASRRGPSSYLVLPLSLLLVSMGSLASPPNATSRRCTAYHQQHKAAGSSLLQALRSRPTVASGLSQDEWFVEGRLTAAARARYVFYCDSPDLDLAERRCLPPKALATEAHNASASSRPPYLIAKGCALSVASLPRFDRQSCVWITVFREPVSSTVPYTGAPVTTGLSSLTRLSTKHQTTQLRTAAHLAPIYRLPHTPPTHTSAKPRSPGS